MAKINRRFTLSLSKGFTLIELMIVIAIIGMVATLGIGSYQISLKRARDAERKTDLQQIRSALEIYRADMAVYPSSDASYQILGCGGAACTWGNAWISGGSAYMDKLPRDPRNVDYRYSSNGSTYTLEACLENANDPQEATSPELFPAGSCASGAIFQVKNP